MSRQSNILDVIKLEKEKVMIRLVGRIPNSFFLACSGGVDSMVALDFFINGKYKPTVLNFDHDTEFGNKAKEFLRKQCRELNIPLIISKIGRDRDRDESMEEYWRTERYHFFSSLPGKVITAHHLDDATEWWVFSSLHGKGKIIPYQHENVIRPFLLTPKSEILSWAERKGVQYLDDPSNKDEKYMRSIIRHQIMSPALKVNPGLRTVVKKKIEAMNKNT